MRITKDGVLLTFHDEDCFRLSGLDNKIIDLDFANLPLLGEKIPLHFSKS